MCAWVCMVTYVYVHIYFTSFYVCAHILCNRSYWRYFKQRRSKNCSLQVITCHHWQILLCSRMPRLLIINKTSIHFVLNYHVSVFIHDVNITFHSLYHTDVCWHHPLVRRSYYKCRVLKMIRSMFVNASLLEVIKCSLVMSLLGSSV